MLKSLNRPTARLFWSEKASREHNCRFSRSTVFVDSLLRRFHRDVQSSWSRFLRIRSKTLSGLFNENNIFLFLTDVWLLVAQARNQFKSETISPQPLAQCWRYAQTPREEKCSLVFFCKVSANLSWVGFGFRTSVKVVELFQACRKIARRNHATPIFANLHIISVGMILYMPVLQQY